MRWLRFLKPAAGVTVLLGLLGGLFAAARVGTVVLFPSHKEILEGLVIVVASGETWSALAHTAFRVFVVITTAIVAGVSFGLIVSNGWGWRLAQPTVDFFRSIPVTFLIPLVTIPLGVQSETVVWLLSSVPCALIMILSVRQGFQSLDHERILAFAVLGGKQRRLSRFKYVIAPELMPQLFTSARLALSYAIVVVTVLEYMNIGNQDQWLGIGALIQREYNASNYSRVVALVLLVGLIGQVLNKLFELLQSKVVHWEARMIS